MRSAQLEDGQGKPTKDLVLVLTPEEIRLLHQSLEEYVAQHKRSKNAAELLKEFESSSIFV